MFACLRQIQNFFQGGTPNFDILYILIFRQILFKFFAPKSECFTEYDAFCACIFDYACLGRKAYCYQKRFKLWKNCIHQKHV